jgi:WhiB family redox-sensing transcriptional regulator
MFDVLTEATEEWRYDAACQNADPELFAPISEVGASLPGIKAAKAICATCPVRRDCLANALATGQPGVIRGGLTEGERRKLREPVAWEAIRARRAAATETAA